LGWVINELTKDPDAHNTLVTSWNPEYLYAMAAPGKAARFPICHNLYQVNIKHGKVCLQLYQRSADVFLGVPFNIGSYALLTMAVAHVTGLEAGTFIHARGPAHLYLTPLERARRPLPPQPRPLPTLRIDPAAKDLFALRYEDF